MLYYCVRHTLFGIVESVGGLINAVLRIIVFNCYYFENETSEIRRSF